MVSFSFRRFYRFDLVRLLLKVLRVWVINDDLNSFNLSLRHLNVEVEAKCPSVDCQMKIYLRKSHRCHVNLDKSIGVCTLTLCERVESLGFGKSVRLKLILCSFDWLLMNRCRLNDEHVWSSAGSTMRTLLTQVTLRMSLPWSLFQS